MFKTKPRGFAANKPQRTFSDILHDHPALFTIALILFIGIAPALVEWLVA